MKQGSLPGRFIALITTAMLLVAGLMFSAVLLVFIVSAGLIVFSYFWWKTRALRRQMREQMSCQTMDDDAGKGEIIEGEVIRRVVTIEEIKRQQQ